MTQYDLGIIGAGPGGYVAALRGAQLGASVALMERENVGGVCLNWGCIPTKALLRSAKVYALTKRAAEFGVLVDEPKLDWAAAQARKAQIVQQLVGNVESLLSKAKVSVLRGTARFASPKVVEVQLADGMTEVEARHFVIATGSHPAQLPVPGLEGRDVIDHAGALSLEALPDSILIIGGGPEGVEFACLFGTCGVRVTLVEMLPRLLPMLEADLGTGLEWVLKQKGIEVLTGSRVLNVESSLAGLTANLSTPRGEQQVSAETVLVCAGRQANVEGLGLELAGVECGPSGIVVDEHLRTSVPHIYAIGDATGGHLLAHVAMREGELAVAHALGEPVWFERKTVPSCVFTNPEVASVGLSETEARQQGYSVQVGRFPFGNNGKALAYGETEGFVKVVVEAEIGLLLGMHAIGPHASDLILEGGLAMVLEATVDEIEATIHAHPTLGEIAREAALASRGRAIHSASSYRTS